MLRLPRRLGRQIFSVPPRKKWEPEPDKTNDFYQFKRQKELQ